MLCYKAAGNFQSSSGSLDPALCPVTYVPGGGGQSYVDVTSSVQILRSGFVYNRGTGQGTQTLSIKNISGQAIPGPIELVLFITSPNTTAVSNTGTFQGNPYWTMSLGSLAAGATSAGASAVYSYPLGGGVTDIGTVYSGALP